VAEIVEGELSIPQFERRMLADGRPSTWMLRPRYLAMALRYVWMFKVRGRAVKSAGVVWLARRAEVRCRRGLGRMELGRGMWVGRGTALLCHEGRLRIGDDVVFGECVTINAYLDVDIGDDCLVADGV
jgi:hypothetical protein